MPKKYNSTLPTTLSGSCLCGDAQYSITTEIEDFYFCHCRQCRKITGSAFASSIQTKPVEVLWISGFEKVKRFDFPGRRTFTKNLFKIVTSRCQLWADGAQKPD